MIRRREPAPSPPGPVPWVLSGTGRAGEGVSGGEAEEKLLRIHCALPTYFLAP